MIEWDDLDEYQPHEPLSPDLWDDNGYTNDENPKSSERSPWGFSVGRY